MGFYFAYGSNMWVKQMQARCPDHQIIGLGVLKGYRWIISSRGYANVVKSPPDAVIGIIYDISVADEKKLDQHEGINAGSYRKELLSVDVDGVPMTCLVYIDPIQDEGHPESEYITRINAGVYDAKLPQEYVLKCIRHFVPG